MDPQEDPPQSIGRLRLGLQLLAAAVGVVLAFWLVSRVAGPGVRGRALSVPTPSVTPDLDFGTPPSGVPLFYFIDGRQPNWLIASDWTGKPRGTIKRSAADGVFPLYASPDGSSMVVGATVYQKGRRLPAWQTGRGLAIWADDNRHMCGFAQTGGADVLQTWVVGLDPATVGQVGPLSSAGLEVVACSFRTNRILVVQSAPSLGIREYWLAGLPTGHLLHHEVLPGGGAAAYTDVIASPDARYVAETLMQPDATAPVALTAAIYDAATGTVLGRLGAGMAVVKFAADSESVLVAGSSTNIVSVVRWRTGKTLWTLSARDLADPHEVLMTSIAKPGGAGFVLAFWRPQSGSCPNGTRTCTTADANPLEELLVVGGDGSRRMVARHVTLVGSGY